MSVDIRLPNKKRKVRGQLDSEPKHIVSPGDVITEDTGYMRGHGTFVHGDKLIATVSGIVERVNKLICVRPFNTRYNGEIGDVVVGRITEVGQKRWKVETFSRLDSVLMLSSVNLPGGELRRRSTKDELMMREYFAEGDLISAEVQSIFADGSLSLHARSLKYGKLGEGTLVQIPSTMVKRCKTHFHNLQCGATVIMGNNGYIWISPLTEQSVITEGLAEQPVVLDDTPKKQITLADRESIARLRNCVVALAEESISLFDTSLMYAYEESMKYSVKDLLKPEAREEIASSVRQQLYQD